MWAKDNIPDQSGKTVIVTGANAGIGFENLRSENSYDPMREYCQSKLADIIFSIELNRRLSSYHELTVSIAAQPGANKTELSRYIVSSP
jgi:hypothetical protein